jgi:hypothetical protein
MLCVALLLAVGAPLKLKHATPPVLYTLPGSGNTWVRMLIDRLVQHESGSVYCDDALRARLSSECTCRANSSVVKAHPGVSFTSLFVPPGLPACGFAFTSAIIVTRNPQAAVWSEYLRQRTGSHVGVVQGYFNQSRFDGEAAALALPVVHACKHAFPRATSLLGTANVLTVRYEDLANPALRLAALRRIGAFLIGPHRFPDHQLQDAFAHAGAFHRPPTPTGFSPAALDRFWTAVGDHGCGYTRNRWA